MNARKRVNLAFRIGWALHLKDRGDAIQQNNARQFLASRQGRRDVASLRRLASRLAA